MSIKDPFEIRAIIAKITKVSFFLGMADHMTCQFTVRSALFIALRTLEWRFICMEINMIVQGLLINVFFLAKTAFIRNFLGMSTHMNGKVLRTATIF